MYFPNEVIGFKEPIYPLSVCGKSGPGSCTPPQMKVQTGIMEISKPSLSKETNTQSRNASKCFVLKTAPLLQSRFRLKRSWEGFDLSNRKALIYITARRQQKQETLCSERESTVPRMALWQEHEFPVRKRKAFTFREDQMHYIVQDVIHINVK